MTKTPKVFLIGFNKCGTSTFHSFFKNHGIPSVHHHFGPSLQNRSKNLALIILQNIVAGRDPLNGISSWTVYSDLSYASDRLCVDACRFFKEIYYYHPKAYYILNTRPVDNWLPSRMNHAGGSLAARWMNAYRCDKATLEVLWRNQFTRHTAEVTQFFSKERANFMVFDIENHSPEHLVRFFAPDFPLNKEKWCVMNATKKEIPNHKPLKPEPSLEPLKPSLEQSGLDALKQAFSQSKVYLEYGCGGSTLLAANTNRLTVVSIDSDQKWIDRVQAHMPSDARNPRKAEILIAPIGHVEAWGRPTDRSKISSWNAYSSLPWFYCSDNSLIPDLILIDGRFRVACFCASFLSAREGATILFDDFFGRPHYNIVKSLVEPIRMHGRMAEFTVPTSRNFSLAGLLLAKYSVQPA